MLNSDYHPHIDFRKEGDGARRALEVAYSRWAPSRAPSAPQFFHKPIRGSSVCLLGTRGLFFYCLQLFFHKLIRNGTRKSFRRFCSHPAVQYQGYWPLSGLSSTPSFPLCLFPSSLAFRSSLYYYQPPIIGIFKKRKTERQCLKY